MKFQNLFQFFIFSLLMVRVFQAPQSPREYKEDINGFRQLLKHFSTLSLGWRLWLWFVQCLAIGFCHRLIMQKITINDDVIHDNIVTWIIWIIYFFIIYIVGSLLWVLTALLSLSVYAAQITLTISIAQDIQALLHLAKSFKQFLQYHQQ